MPDEERTVAQLAAAFRQVLAEEERGRADHEHADPEREGRGEAIAALAWAALGDSGSLPPNDTEEPD